MVSFIIESLIQIHKLSPDTFRLRAHTHGLIVNAKATCMRSTSLAKLSLKHHEFTFFSLYNFSQLVNLLLRLHLISLELRLHFETFSVVIKKLVVGLAKQTFHLVNLLPHSHVLLFKVGEITH